MRLVLLISASLWLGAQPPPADLNSVREEHDPEKRYWKALLFASGQLDEARKDYQEGTIEPFHVALGNVQQAVQLCDESLRATGKNPSKSPKHFKRAELRERELLRRLTSLEEEVSIDDRAAVTKVRTRVNEIHDEMLFDIMGRRRK